MALIVVIQNTSNLAALSNYRYQVLVGDGTVERSKVLASGVITGHERAAGWQVLVRRLLDAETPDPPICFAPDQWEATLASLAAYEATIEPS